MKPEDVARILDDLGQRLGPAGQHVFELAVRQQIIEGAIPLGVFLVGLLICATTARRFGAAWNTDNPTPPAAAFMVGAVLTIVAGIGVFSEGIAKLLNPEYAALTDILSKIVR